MARDDRRNIYQILYVSGATEELSGRELRSLANAAALQNDQLGVTGLLLYSKQRFMQFLEGKIMTVGGLFEVIRNDPRHHGILVMRRGFVPFREFPDWSMRLARSGEIADTESEVYSRLFANQAPGSSARQRSAETWVLLNAFHHT